MEIEWKLFLASVIFAIFQSGFGIVVLRFSKVVDKLTEAVDRLSLADQRTSTTLSEHGRRLDNHDEDISRIDARCFEQLKNHAAMRK